MRRKKPPPIPPAEEGADVVLQLTIRLNDVSPSIWRRVLVPATMTLRELHGVIQVAMGWKGIHLFRFRIHAGHYGSWQLGIDSPEKKLLEFELRSGARFTYDYDLNLPWEHELRLEDVLSAEAGLQYPFCLNGKESCPPEECPGPEWYMENRYPELTIEGAEDFEALSDLLQELQEKDDAGTRCADSLNDIQAVVERIEEREEWRGIPFKLAQVNDRFRNAEHLDLMHQQVF